MEANTHGNAPHRLALRVVDLPGPHRRRRLLPAVQPASLVAFLVRPRTAYRATDGLGRAGDLLLFLWRC